jgi:hypothetical protein
MITRIAAAANFREVCKTTNRMFTASRHYLSFIRGEAAENLPARP